MLPISEAPKFTKWFCASIGTSLFLLVCIGCRLLKPIYRTSNVYSSLVSSIATAFPVIITVFYNNPDVAYNLLFLIYGYQLVFDSISILYTFQCILKNKQGFGKLLVYVGYVWILFNIGTFFAFAIVSRKKNWRSNYEDVYYIHNLVSISALSIFGFILALLLLFFIANRRISSQVFNYMITYVVLDSIAFFGITILISAHIQTFELFDAICFLFIDLPVKTIIVITAYYGDIRAKKFCSDRYTNYETWSDTLESKQYQIV